MVVTASIANLLAECNAKGVSIDRFGGRLHSPRSVRDSR